MESRYALVFDRSKPFTGRLRSMLHVIGYEAHVIVGPKALLDHLAEDMPAIIFLAVDQPRKLGFSLFIEVKRLAKQVPVVLMTSSVSREEMRLHQSLRLHADAYLDKRELSDVEILDTLNELLRVGLDPQEVERLAASGDESRSSAAGSRSQERALYATEPEALVDEIDEALTMSGDGAGSTQAAAALVKPPTTQQTKELQAEVKRLKRELELAQCAVNSSPFSEEYRKLKSRIRQAEEEAEPLREELASRQRQLRLLEAKLVDSEPRMRTLQDNLRAGQEQVMALDQKLAQEIQRRVTTEHANAAALEDLHARLLEEKRLAVTRVTEESERKLAECRREHTAALKEVSEQARQQSSEALKDSDAAWQKKMKVLADEHARDLERQLQEHQKETADLVALHEKTLSAERQSFKDELARAAADYDENLSANSQQWQRRLREAREEFESTRADNSEALEERYRMELQELRDQHAMERERLQRVHAEGLESLSMKLRQKDPEPAQATKSLLWTKLEEKRQETEHAPSAEEEDAQEAREPSRQPPQVRNPVLWAKIEEKRRESERAPAAEKEVGRKDPEPLSKPLQVKNPVLRARLEEKLRGR